MARCEPCRSTALCSLSSSFLPLLPACHFTNRCCPKKKTWSDHTAAFQTGSRLPGSCQGPRGADRNGNHRGAAAGPGCLCCRRKELQQPRRRHAEFCSPPLLGHRRKSAASFHCAGCTSSVPRGSPPTSLGEEGERLAGMGSVGLKGSGQEAPDLQGPGGEDIGAAKH